MEWKTLWPIIYTIYLKTVCCLLESFAHYTITGIYINLILLLKKCSLPKCLVLCLNLFSLQLSLSAARIKCWLWLCPWWAWCFQFLRFFAYSADQYWRMSNQTRPIPCVAPARLSRADWRQCITLLYTQSVLINSSEHVRTCHSLAIIRWLHSPCSLFLNEYACWGPGHFWLIKDDSTITVCIFTTVY